MCDAGYNGRDGHEDGEEMFETSTLSILEVPGNNVTKCVLHPSRHYQEAPHVFLDKFVQKFPEAVTSASADLLAASDNCGTAEQKAPSRRTKLARTQLPAKRRRGGVPAHVSRPQLEKLLNMAPSAKLPTQMLLKIAGKKRDDALPDATILTVGRTVTSHKQLDDYIHQHENDTRAALEYEESCEVMGADAPVTLTDLEMRRTARGKRNPIRQSVPVRNNDTYAAVLNVGTCRIGACIVPHRFADRFPVNCFVNVRRYPITGPGSLITLQVFGHTRSEVIEVPPEVYGQLGADVDGDTVYMILLSTPGAAVEGLLTMGPWFNATVNGMPKYEPHHEQYALMFYLFNVTATAFQKMFIDASVHMAPPCLFAIVDSICKMLDTLAVYCPPHSMRRTDELVREQIWEQSGKRFDVNDTDSIIAYLAVHSLAPLTGVVQAMERKLTEQSQRMPMGECDKMFALAKCRGTRFTTETIGAGFNKIMSTGYDQKSFCEAAADVDETLTRGQTDISRVSYQTTKACCVSNMAYVAQDHTIVDQNGLLVHDRISHVQSASTRLAQLLRCAAGKTAPENILTFRHAIYAVYIKHKSKKFIY